MTSQIPTMPGAPGTLYGPIAVERTGEPVQAQPQQKCVDCALTGTEPLPALFTVSGTLLCRTHAIAERTRTLADAPTIAVR